MELLQANSLYRPASGGKGPSFEMVERKVVSGRRKLPSESAYFFDIFVSLQS
jgi:hypothetical protein